MRIAVAAVAALLLLGGCGGDDDDNPAPAPRPKESKEARAIRNWSAALNAGRYEEAASFFADGAVVEQAREFRLPDHDAALAFNRGLPCKADVTDIDDEGDTLLAAFRLRAGPLGGCNGGTVRVRFRFRGGKFSEWRQLPESDAPQSEVI